jgi:hypothetical protein
MDPAIIADTAMKLITPLLIKLGTSTIEEVGKNLPDKIGNVWNTIISRFQGNSTASGAANDLTKDPNDVDNQETFSLQLRKALKEDPDFANLLNDLLDQVDGGVNIIGDNNVSIRDFKIGGDLSGNLTIGNNNQIQ